MENESEQKQEQATASGPPRSRAMKRFDYATLRLLHITRYAEALMEAMPGLYRAGEGVNGLSKQPETDEEAEQATTAVVAALGVSLAACISVRRVVDKLASSTESEILEVSAYDPP